MEDNQHYEWGVHSFLRGIILFGFTMLFLSLIMSGNIAYYIAPKMMPFVYFSLITFLILSIMQIIRSTPKGQQEEIECDCGTGHHIKGSVWKKIAIYSIFIFPLLTGFLLPDQILNNSVAATRGVQLGSGIYSKPDIQRQGEDNLTTNSGSSTDRVDQFLSSLEEELAASEEIDHYILEDTYDLGFDDYYARLASNLAGEQQITIDDDNFLDMMAVLDLYLDQFQGKQVEVMGFVYREEGLDMDEMVVARFSMTCCVADAAVYGLLIKGEATKDYENDTWVKVKGSIAKTEFHDWIIPMIHLEEAIEVEIPDTPYVYPSFF